jgi:hypothetical protein
MTVAFGLIPEDDRHNTDNFLDHVDAYEMREDTPAVPLVHRIGSHGLGIDLTVEAWPRLDQVFYGGDDDVPVYFDRPPCVIAPSTVYRLPKQYLRRHPVDLLILGNLDVPTLREWIQKIPRLGDPKAPKLVVEYWNPWFITQNEDGPMSKLMVTQWETKGYLSTCKIVDAVCAGGVVDRQWLIVARYLKTATTGWTWPDLPNKVPRPMANCLRYTGVPGSAYRQVPSDFNGPIPDATYDCMPGYPGAVIKTDRGIRRLLHDEYATGLGVPKHWARKYPPGGLVKRTIDLHLLEYITPNLLSPAPRPPDTSSERGRNVDSIPVPKTDPLKAVQSCVSAGENLVFTWRPPDLSPGSEWTRETIRTLRVACDHYDDSENLFQEGLECLARHRKNYDAEGPNPTKLQLLWWEFPAERWDEIRQGCSMNFLRDPISLIQPNSDMTEEQLEIAEEFLCELVDLGVLLEVDSAYVKTNSPIFCLPKPGQPGQWRVLADMKKGLQNEAIGADPTTFPKTIHILEQLYSGGFSAVVDLSKFFYNFPTVPAERCFLGVVSSRTGKAYVWGGLPMGSGNSPSIAGRGGASLIRKLREACSRYQGEIHHNTWWKAFSSDQKFNPDLSHGRYLLSDEDGLPAVLVFGHCDDFLLHGPTWFKTALALRDFLDLCLRVGLLAHPGKLTPPCQEVKYTGFLWNTESVPTLKIPSYKVDKSLALIDFALSNRNSLSRLCLSVIKGVLESVVDATPSRTGHTHLRSMEIILHPPGWEEAYLPYYSFTSLSDKSAKDLLWWRSCLTANHGRQSRAAHAEILIPSFGDGSGTGTGGTVQYYVSHPMERWKAVWDVPVMRMKRSSNWKEVATLRLTLQRAKAQKARVQGCTFFYFTDNIFTYFRVMKGASRSPGLQEVVEDIKLLEAELGCHLEVIHIPGTAIITQSTDGLSRGIWYSPLHEHPPQTIILHDIFAPLGFSDDVGDWARSQAGIPPSTEWHFRHWDAPWEFASVANRLTIWTPPPEVAAQLLHFLLLSYVEASASTSCLLLIPRILQLRWSRMSRIVLTIGIYQRSFIPLYCHSVLTIPVVLLYIPCHVRALPIHRLDSSALTTRQRLHQAEATSLRRLLETVNAE